MFLTGEGQHLKMLKYQMSHHDHRVRSLSEGAEGESRVHP